MAQKKVILKDGQDELMPKTLASMVFTSDGTSVEAALENIGGGGTPSGDGGNVKVTNASGLVSSNYYAFKPSANGSVEGTFSTIPNATESKAGLMSASNYGKLDDMKPVIALPVSVLEYNAETTSETIEAMLQTAFGESTSNVTALQFVYTASILQGEYNSSFQKFYIGDRECLLGGNVVTDGSYISQATLEFSYVDGGKLHTVAITMTVDGDINSGSATFTYSAKVLESGDDTYYLPGAVYGLSAGATHEDIIAALGGSIDSVVAAIKEKKHLFFAYNSLGVFDYSIPVTASQIANSGFFLSFMRSLNNSPDGEIQGIMCYISNPSASAVKTFCLSGYSLPDSFFSLTSSSESDEISTAVGGESGLKAIIQALKDGNRLKGKYVIPNSNPSQSVELTVTSSTYVEGDNGDLSLLLGSEAFVVIGFIRIGITINYTKSSNTFACVVITD